MSRKKVSTGIEELDHMLEGGFLKGRNILVSGPCGVGKTTFAAHFLTHGVHHENERSLYITLEQPKSKITQDLKSVGIHFDEAEKTGNFHIVGGPIAKIRKHMKKIDASTHHLIEEMEDIIKKHKIDRVVIDSINLLTMFSNNKYERREILATLCHTLAKHGCTTLLLAEHDNSEARLSEHGIEEYIMDGVIALYHHREGARFTPAIAVRKIRGTNHDRFVRPYKITAEGIQIDHQKELHPGKLK